MFRKFVAMTVCVSVCTLALGCNGATGGGGSDEQGKAAIQDAAKKMQEKRAAEEGK